MDQRPRASQRVETDGAGIRRRIVEGKLESERERAGCQRRRQQGQLMEGEPKGGMGLRQVDRGVGWRLRMLCTLYEEKNPGALLSADDYQRRWQNRPAASDHHIGAALDVHGLKKKDS